MIRPESVAAILFSEDRTSVLLIQRRDVPVWVLPGGGLEPSETPEEAAKREFTEETGLTVQIDRLVGVYLPINRLTRRTHLYECKLLGGHLKTTSETRGVLFFPLSSLPSLIPTPYREWIADARALNPPIEKPLASVTYATLLKNLLLHPTLVLRFLLARLGVPINSR